MTPFGRFLRVGPPTDRIKVTVKNGWVTLEGMVDWEFERRLAESAVKKLKGVIGVTNNIDAPDRALFFKMSEENDITSAVEPTASALAAEELRKEQKRYIRLLSDFENYRRRMERERENAARADRRTIMLSLLEVVDDFDRALQHLDTRGNRFGGQRSIYTGCGGRGGPPRLPLGRRTLEAGAGAGGTLSRQTFRIQARKNDPWHGKVEVESGMLVLEGERKFEPNEEK